MSYLIRDIEERRNQEREVPPRDEPTVRKALLLVLSGHQREVRDRSRSGLDQGVADKRLHAELNLLTEHEVGVIV